MNYSLLRISVCHVLNWAGVPMAFFKLHLNKSKYKEKETRTAKACRKFLYCKQSHLMIDVNVQPLVNMSVYLQETRRNPHWALLILSSFAWMLLASSSHSRGSTGVMAAPWKHRAFCTLKFMPNTEDGQSCMRKIDNSILWLSWTSAVKAY